MAALKRVLLTGAGGYLGSRLAKALHRSGSELVLLARDFERTKNAIQEAGASVVDGRSVDFADRAARRATFTTDLLRDCDAVFHLGADLSFAGSAQQREINVCASEELFAAASAARVPSFVFASSIDATGSSSAPGARGIDEYGFHAAYGLSKLLAEERLLARESETALAILRLGILTGDADNFTPGMRDLCTKTPALSELADIKLSLLETQRAIEAMIDAAASTATLRCHALSKVQSIGSFAHDEFGAELSSSAAAPTGEASVAAECRAALRSGQATLASYLAWPIPELAGRDFGPSQALNAQA